MYTWQQMLLPALQFLEIDEKSHLKLTVKVNISSSPGAEFKILMFALL